MGLGHKDPCKSDGFYVQRHVSRLGPRVLRLLCVPILTSLALLACVWDVYSNLSGVLYGIRPQRTL